MRLKVVAQNDGDFVDVTVADHFLKKKNSFCTSEALAHILWKPTVHYLVHYSPSPVPVLSQNSPVLKFHFNILPPSNRRSSKVRFIF